MEKKSKKELVKIGSEMKPTVHVGKDGLTEGIVVEIRAQIKNSKIVKVKVLPSAEMDIKEIAAELEEKTSAKMVETRGFTVLLCDARIYECKTH